MWYARPTDSYGRRIPAITNSRHLVARTVTKPRRRFFFICRPSRSEAKKLSTPAMKYSLFCRVPLKSSLPRQGDYAQFPGLVRHRLRGIEAGTEVLVVVAGGKEQ